MRKRARIYCKDCLAWQSYWIGNPPPESNGHGVCHRHSIDDLSPDPDHFCLQAVPIEPIKCEDCFYWIRHGPDPLDDAVSREGDCVRHCTPSCLIKNKDWYCGDAWPAEKEGE